ncbi:MAG: efflux RND transporter periplasmic adaptor subunit [Candidatus Moraniibacteriota bacterium]
MKKIIKIVSIVVVVLFVVWLVWQRFASNNNDSDIDSYVVNIDDVMETVSASGKVTPVNYANLSFVSPALVKSVSVDVGDTVEEGQVLIVIDRNSIIAEIQSARIDVEKAQAAEQLARRHWDDYKPEEKERIRKDVEQARTRLYGAQSHFKNTEVVSPIDGIVTQKNVRVGEVAQGIVMRVIDENDMEIEILMSETDAAKMNKDQKAFAIFDAYNDEQFDVDILRIDPEAVRVQDVTYYNTTFALPENIDKNILSGMSVDVDVVVNQKNNVLTVPLRFVRSDDDGEYVYIKTTDEQYNKQYIVTGVEGDDGDVEVSSGLNEGIIIYAVDEEDLDDK